MKRKFPRAMTASVHAVTGHCIYCETCMWTWTKENECFEAAVLGRIDVERLEFLHLLLEDANVIHERHDPVSGHGTGVESGGSEQRRHVEGHRTLGGVEHEQLTPRQPQQRNLVRHLETSRPAYVNTSNYVQRRRWKCAEELQR